MEFKENMEEEIETEHSEKMLEALLIFNKFIRHDLWNKITIIKDALEALQKGSKIAKPEKLFRMTIENLRSVEQILDSSRNHDELFSQQNFKYVELTDIFSEAICMNDERRMGVDIVIIDCEKVVVLNPLMNKVLYTLIDNSLTHGEGISKIKLACQKRKDEIILIYEDNGVGIPKERKEKIFEKGFSGGGGTGLGLFLTRKLCDMYGWQITETGEPEKGARFEIIIPKKNGDLQQNYGFL